MTPRVHRFESTGDAYDSSQTGYFPDDAPYDHRDPYAGMVEVENGDVLVVESERAVAVMVEAWPVAISPERKGESFHTHDDSWDWSAVPLVGGGGVRDYSESVAAARAEATRLASGADGTVRP